MSRVWEPERVVDEREASQLVANHFPQLQPVKAKAHGQGFDNTVYLINGSYIFRFPRRRVAVPLIKTETQLLGKLSAILPVPVPHPQFYASKGSEEFPWPFMGYLRLPGQTACTLALDDDQRIDLAPQIARFMSALHRVPVNDTRACGVGLDPIGRYEIETRIRKTVENLDEARTLDLIDARKRNLLVDQLQAARSLPTPIANTLVHGDLYARHLLLEQGELTGVIDWGDVHIGTPATDLSLVHSLLPPSARQAFFSVYGPVPEETMELARFRAICHTSAVLVYAHHQSDQALLKEAVCSIANLCEV